MIRFSETEIRNSAKEAISLLKDMEKNTLITNLRMEKV